MSSKPKRVLIKHATNAHGIVFYVPDKIEDLLQSVGASFGCTIERLFTRNGGEIRSLDVIRDDEELYAAKPGEAFSVPPSECGAPMSLVENNSEWILLNVGGKHFATTRSTLISREPESMLGRMFSPSRISPSAVDSQGAYMIDRSAAYFEPILNYLRHGQLVIESNLDITGILEEAKFFGIQSMVSLLEQRIGERHEPDDYTPLTRRDVVSLLAHTSHDKQLRFQGVNLSGADLSRLDLRHINFKYAVLQRVRLTGANLSFCCLERADLSFANLENATLSGARMMCANLEGAILRSSNMEDQTGTNKTNLEGVNLKNADLEGSLMGGVNLRVATLKNANLQNCHLRQAILAGADLENANLSGSDLHEANLRGANLKETTMELMVTPLHMSQAIR